MRNGVNGLRRSCLRRSGKGGFERVEHFDLFLANCAQIVDFNFEYITGIPEIQIAHSISKNARIIPDYVHGALLLQRERTKRFQHLPIHENSSSCSVLKRFAEPINYFVWQLSMTKLGAKQ